MLKQIITLLTRGYVLVIILVLWLGLMAIADMNRLHQVVSDLYDHPFTVSNTSLGMKSALFEIRIHMLKIVLVKNNSASLAQMNHEIEGFEQQVSSDLKVIKANFMGDMSRVYELERLLVQWKTLRSEIFRHILAGKHNEAEKIFATVASDKFEEISSQMNYIVSFAQHKAATFDTEADMIAEAHRKWTWVLLTGLIMTIAGTWLILTRRISQIINREEEVEAALKTYSVQLEDANKELESFSYSVSHDLRVPLRAIDGFSRIIQEEYFDKLDAEGQRLLNVVRDNTKKMAQLIDDILAFSRAGRQGIAASVIDMAELVRSVMDELKPAVVGREIKLEIKALPPAHADRIMMGRVFTNLLTNSIKFTRHTAEPQIEVGAKTGDRETIYYVKDNGIGFDMQYVDKLFGMFQRLHGADEFEGTGIGLSIVKRVISRHGGRVWAEGKLNEGATIYFTLPTKEGRHG